MNENIDLTKILKDCPIGWKFYSSVYGDVEFLGVSHCCPVPLHGQDYELYLMDDLMRKKYPIRIKSIFGEYDVSHEGKLRVGVGECTLFPSRAQRDWSKFTAPWYKHEKFNPKTLQPFDKVLVRDECCEKWRCDLYSHYDSIKINDGGNYPYVTINSNYGYCIPYNDKTRHLIGTTEEAPEYYRYWKDRLWQIEK